MRLGAPVYHWSTPEEWAQEHVRKGFAAAYWPLKADADPETEQEYVRAAKKHGLIIAEVGIWNNLLDPDPEKAKVNRAYSIARMRQAERIGARCCVNVSGSCGPIWDGPHRDNLTGETFERIVRLTQEMIDEAELDQTSYALEPMPWMYPTDADSTQRLIDAVDRRQFGVHVDMVNMINSAEKIYRTGEITKEFFTRLRGRIVSVHAKDIAISDELTTHLSEVLCGTGDFDLKELLIQCSLTGDIPVMAEHLNSEEEYDRATDCLKKVAKDAGLIFYTEGIQ